MSLPTFTAWALPGIPLIQPGNNLVQIIEEALARADFVLQPHDLLVISSKIVSKAEGRFFRLDEVIPGPEAIALADETNKDPRIVELILRESVSVSRKARNVLVTQHRLGFVSANSGVDQSNVAPGGGQVLLLPLDPDATAESIRRELQQHSGAEVGVVISDTHGRPFRLGNVGVAIGAAGLPALMDMRGGHDLFGRELLATIQGYADLVASAAHLLCGEADEGRPVILLRGLEWSHESGRASDLNRPPEMDLYR